MPNERRQTSSTINKIPCYSTTHTTTRVSKSNFMFTGMETPCSSFGRRISNLARIEAVNRNRASLLKYRPGQILHSESMSMRSFQRAEHHQSTESAHLLPNPNAARSPSGTEESIWSSFKYRSGLNSKGASNTSGSCIIALVRAQVATFSTCRAGWDGDVWV